MTSTVEEHAHYEYVVARQSRVSAFLTRLLTRSPAWAAPAAVAVCLGGAVAYTFLDRPLDKAADAPPTCLLKLTTGFDCPGCGGTRAFWYLMHGNVPAAARHHAMFVFVVPFLIYMYVAWTVNTVSRRKLPMIPLSPKVLSIFLAAWGVFSVLRNLPWAPFTWWYV